METKPLVGSNLTPGYLGFYVYLLSTLDGNPALGKPDQIRVSASLATHSFLLDC
jgi:hypothetical protein